MTRPIDRGFAFISPTQRVGWGFAPRLFYLFIIYALRAPPAKLVFILFYIFYICAKGAQGFYFFIIYALRAPPAKLVFILFYFIFIIYAPKALRQLFILSYQVGILFIYLICATRSTSEAGIYFILFFYICATRSRLSFTYFLYQICANALHQRSWYLFISYIRYALRALGN